MTEENQDLDNTVELGGNIVLSGFRAVDGATMIILKKMIGNYVKKFAERTDKFENLSLTVKPIHQSQDQKSKKYEMHAKLLDNGKMFNSEVVDNNLFVAVDSVLKKIESERFR
jgi:ribosome-associated translation inhibitor RaiA